MASAFDENNVTDRRQFTKVSQQMVIYIILGVNIVYVKRQKEHFNVLCATVMYSYMELHRNTIHKCLALRMCEVYKAKDGRHNRIKNKLVILTICAS